MRTLRRIRKLFADHTAGDILVSSMHVLSEFAWSKVLMTVLCFITSPNANSNSNKVWSFFEVISEAKDLQVWVSTWRVYYERNEREKKIHHLHNLQLKFCEVCKLLLIIIFDHVSYLATSTRIWISSNLQIIPFQIQKCLRPHVEKLNYLNSTHNSPDACRRKPYPKKNVAD